MRTSLEMVSQFVSDENLHGIPMVLIDICDKFEEWVSKIDVEFHHKLSETYEILQPIKIPVIIIMY